jgi:hypothetical protein
MQVEGAEVAMATAGAGPRAAALALHSAALTRGVALHVRAYRRLASFR